MSLKAFDLFGYGAATITALELFEMTSRRTGRTTATIARLKAGDVLIVPDERERKRIEAEIRRQKIEGVTVTSIETDLGTLPESLTRLRAAHPNARPVFSHDWFFRYFREALRSAAAAPLQLTDHFFPPDKAQLVEREVMQPWRFRDFAP
jgi:hypothetical protein